MDSNTGESRKINKMFENKLEKKEKIGDWRNRIQRRTQMIIITWHVQQQQQQQQMLEVFSIKIKPEN